MLKYEIRDDSSANAAADAQYNQMLVDKQDDLCGDYDWEFLARKWLGSVSALSNTCSIPTVDTTGNTSTINYSRPVQVWVNWSARWQPVDYGITPAEYNIRNPTLNEVQDPIMRYAFWTNVDETLTPNLLEVWPKTSAAQQLMFTGQRAPLSVPIADDTKKFDLDDSLIVYGVASDILQYRGLPNAGNAEKRFQDEMKRQRAGYPTKEYRLVLGRSLEDDFRKQHYPPVPITVA